jgi:hypothetical protein
MLTDPDVRRINHQSVAASEIMKKIGFAGARDWLTVPIQNFNQIETRVCQLPRLRLRTDVIGHEREVMPTIG